MPLWICEIAICHGFATDIFTYDDLVLILKGGGGRGASFRPGVFGWFPLGLRQPPQKGSEILFTRAGPPVCLTGSGICRPSMATSCRIRRRGGSPRANKGVQGRALWGFLQRQAGLGFQCLLVLAWLGLAWLGLASHCQEHWPASPGAQPRKPFVRSVIQTPEGPWKRQTGAVSFACSPKLSKADGMNRHLCP